MIIKKSVIYILIIFFSINVYSGEKLFFASNEKLIEQKIAGHILTKLLKKNDFEVQIRELPPSRANSENTALQVDGEIARIFSYLDSNPTLIRIEPAYYYLETSVFCLKNKKIKLKTAEELKDHSVAAIRGVAHSDRLLVNHKNSQYVSNSEEMFKLLLSGRVDFAIDTDINGRKILNQLKLHEIETCGKFSKLDLYVYLNTKSKKLADKIAKILLESKKSGELLKLQKIAEKEAL